MRLSILLRIGFLAVLVASAGQAAAKNCAAERVKGVSDWWWEQASAKAEAVADWRARAGTKWSRAHDRSFYCVRILGAWQCSARAWPCGR
jgi:hypothetical protein